MPAILEPVERSKLTPPQLAARWGISPDKIVAWIRSGELRAIDAATRRGGRPRYLIDLADVLAFEEGRAIVPPTRDGRRQVPHRRRQPTEQAGITQFFK
jgi:hypothetical protein